MWVESVRWVPRPLSKPGPPDPGEREAQQPVGAVALGEPVAKVGQDAVVEAGVFQLQAEGVLEVDAAAHRLGRLSVGKIEQELQHVRGGEPGGREARTLISRVPVSEILVVPQSVEAVTYSYRRRTVQVARPRELRGQRRDLFTRTGTEGQRAPLQRHRFSKQPEHAC
jgi:hypothetical protein